MRLNNHMFICGITNSGKTTFARKLFDQLDGVRIFINTQYEPQIVEASSIAVSSFENFVKAFNLKHKKICVEFENEDFLKEIKEAVFVAGRQMPYSRSKAWCYVFVDEVHLFGERDEILDIWKRGKRHGVIGIAISQRPADTSHTILTQSVYHVVFDLSPYETPYFERYRIPIGEFKDWINKKYHYVIFDGKNVKKFAPVKI